MAIVLNKPLPEFEANATSGLKVSNVSHLGQPVVLFFYPKDMTPTCTVEACNLRDNYTALQKQGIHVLGISPDDESSHTKFIGKHELPYPLLADPEQKMLTNYGVWGEKSMYGRKYMGVLRTTFLINEDGKIHDVISKVEAKNHAAQILKVWGLK
jgi:peroxiredoxin Q/BCP